MTDTYICTQCGAEYDAPGVCEMCQCDLIPLDEYEEEQERKTFEADNEDDQLSSDDEKESKKKDEDYDNGSDSYNDKDDY